MTNSNTQEIKTQVESQHSFFSSGQTRTVDFRLQQLKRLKHVLKDNEDQLFDALKQDFQKPAFETYGTELGILYEEIDLHLKKTPKWSRPQRVSGSLINFPSKDYIYSQPYGVSLVIGAWNYPILLALHPVVSSIAAGNTVVLKPSELAEHTSRLLHKLISTTFSPDFFTVIEGEVETGKILLEQPFDFIFFTGSTRVGRIVMQAAAKQLTPVVLELGGKSPAIVDTTADLALAAKRIAWGKYLNAGQTCVAPDYLLVESTVKEELLTHLKEAITQFYGKDPAQSSDYPRIINQNHFNRLRNLLDDGNIVIGGNTDSRDLYIGPTILDDIAWGDTVMQEEVFGPVLPILTYDTLDEIIEKVNNRPTPLSLYLFTSDEKVKERVINLIAFGGGCINDTVAHLGNSNLPFGGKGASGMGQYHGKSGFDTFSHKKSIMKKATWFDNPFRYAPYGNKLKWLKKIFN